MSVIFDVYFIDALILVICDNYLLKTENGAFYTIINTFNKGSVEVIFIVVQSLSHMPVHINYYIIFFLYFYHRIYISLEVAITVISVIAQTALPQ